MGSNNFISITLQFSQTTKQFVSFFSFCFAVGSFHLLHFILKIHIVAEKILFHVPTKLRKLSFTKSLLILEVSYSWNKNTLYYIIDFFWIFCLYLI